MPLIRKSRATGKEPRSISLPERDWGWLEGVIDGEGYVDRKFIPRDRFTYKILTDEDKKWLAID